MSYCEPETPSCFENIIEVKGNCSNKTAYSNIYLDDVGIKLNELDSIIGEEYENGEQLFYEKRNYAIKSVTQSIHTHLTENYKAISLLKSERVGRFQDNLQQVPAEAGKMKGIYVELCNDTSFVDFYLNFLEVQFDFTGDVNILVYDLIQNRLLDTLTVSAVAQNIVQLYVNKVYKSDRKRLKLFIGYDTTTVPSFKTFSFNYSGCWSCIDYFYKNSFAKFCGATTQLVGDKIQQNITRSGETFGLSLNYSINCNHEDWLCSYGRALAIPIALYTAREIAFYAINISQQANPKTFIDAEKWKARWDKYDADFETKFKEVLQNINLPSDTRCFHCMPKLVHAISIP